MKKKGFTLIEILAVIVILAILLVMAVPKMLDVMKATKLSSIENSAKLIAKTAEQKKLEKQIVTNNSKIECSDIAEYNTNDYGTCTINFNNGEATVILRGKGKFKGLKCVGTKDNMECTESITPEYVYSFEQPYFDYTYTVANSGSCKLYVKNVHLRDNYIESESEKYATSICNGEGVNYDYYETSEWFDISINYNVFAYDEEISGFLSRTGTEGNYTYTVTNASACKAYLKEFHLNDGNSETQSERYATSICNGEGVYYGYSTTNEWFSKKIDIYDDEVTNFLSVTGNEGNYNYIVTNISTCKAYLKDYHLDHGYSEARSEKYAASICNEEGVDYEHSTTNEWFKDKIDYNIFAYDSEVSNFLNRDTTLHNVVDDYIELIDNDNHQRSVFIKWTRNTVTYDENAAKEICIMYGGATANEYSCFKNNDYANEKLHMYEVFGNNNCMIYNEGSQYEKLNCSSENFTCEIGLIGNIMCHGYYFSFGGCANQSCSEVMN